MREQATLLIAPDSHGSLGNNLNGPSLIRVPEWVERPLGRYYLYFAHHQGSFIRLAYADQITGPYEIHEPGTLRLEESGFPAVPLVPAEIRAEGILEWIRKYDAETILPFFPPHIASPDVHVRETAREIWMYYHGQVADGRQLTKVARSRDGLQFVPEPGFLGSSYFRVFRHGDAWYALSHSGGVINRSSDGIHFEAGPAIGESAMRHTAVRRVANERFEVYWSRYGDNPEHILVSDLEVSGPWRSWRVGKPRSVRKPQYDWEGAELPVAPSLIGFARAELHELRDPAIYEEAGRCYLLYSVKGESGIGICEL